MYKMITRQQSKTIISLQRKRAREEQGLFVIEGDKLVREYLAAGNSVSLLVAKPEWLLGNEADLTGSIDEIVTVSYDELRRISSLKTPHNVLALAPVISSSFSGEELKGKITLALEYIQDPGNLGTIIRIAAWFGIKTIICSPDCVDYHNTKVIQATMGAFMHVEIHYLPLEPILTYAGVSGIPVYGTVIEGTSVYEKELSGEGIIVMGNESKGLSDRLLNHITERITIPGPGVPLAGIESLNVGMATAIICSEFARRKLL